MRRLLAWLYVHGYLSLRLWLNPAERYYGGILSWQKPYSVWCPRWLIQSVFDEMRRSYQ